MISQSDNELSTRIRGLNGDQMQQVLNFIEGIRERHNTRIYRRKAMRQIREALNSDF